MNLQRLNARILHHWHAAVAAVRADDRANINMNSWMLIVIGIFVVVSLIPDIVTQINAGNESLSDGGFTSAATLLKLIPLVLVAGFLIKTWRSSA